MFQIKLNVLLSVIDFIQNPSDRLLITSNSHGLIKEDKKQLKKIV